MLFPERVELEQDPNMQKAEEGNADTASDGGLKNNTAILAGQTFSRRSRMESKIIGTKRWVGTFPYSFAAQMITSTAQLRWRTQKYSGL